MPSLSPWNRRDVLRSLIVASGALPSAGFAQESPARRRVAVVGAGVAGVSVAWLLDGVADVVLLEARGTVGGNIRSARVDVDGETVDVDLGAQYFHPGPYPTYARLLEQLGLFPPSADPAAFPRSHAFVGSITLTASDEATPRFVSPTLPGRAWPLAAGWNLEGLRAFSVGFSRARARERAGANWLVSLEDWLPTLGLSQRQWEGMLLPWAASLYSGRVDEARDLSARGAMVFAAGALPQNVFEPLRYYVLSPGLGEALRRMLDQCTTVSVQTKATVQQVVRLTSGPVHTGSGGHGPFRIRCTDGRTFEVDDLVLAASGPGSRHLLRTLTGTGLQRIALSGIEFFEARLALHTDPAFASTTSAFRSFLNCDVRQDGTCEASMWMADVLSRPSRPAAARLWKSWITHRDPPGEILAEETYQHMRPSIASVRAQQALRALNGRDGVWFAGGYLHPYDAQETALRSALDVVAGMGVASPRAQSLA